MSKSKILLSVIIPARNRPEFTSQAIDSVLKQEPIPNVSIEIYVIDNRSDPPLRKIIGRHFPSVNFVRSRGFDSPGGTRNFGLKQAKGDYIAFLDNDDMWFPNFLKESYKVLFKHNSPATVCLTWPFFYGPYPRLEIVKLLILNLIRLLIFLCLWALNSRQLPKSGFYLCQISHMLFNAKFIKDIQFNETAVAAEDWEFIAESTLKREILIVPKPLTKFRYSWSSNTNTTQVRAKKWNAYQDLIKKLPPPHKTGLLSTLFDLYIRSFGSQ